MGIVQAIPALLEQLPAIITSIADTLVANMPMILETGMQLLLRRRTLRPREESLLVLHPCKHHYPSGTQRDQFPGSPLYYHTIPTQ